MQQSPHLASGAAQPPSPPGQLSSDRGARWDGHASLQSTTRYRSPGARRTWSVAFLSAWIVSGLLLVLAEINRLSLVNQVLAGQAISHADAINSDSLVAQLNGLHLLSYLGAGIAFLMWLHRVVSNNGALGALGLRFTPGWAVGWWFIPFANFVRPAQVVEEAWHAASTLPRSTPTPSPWLVRLWWGAWILTNVIAGVAITLGARTASALHDETVALIVGQAVGMIAALLAIAVVVRLTSRQHEKRRGAAPVMSPVLQASPPSLAPSLD